MQRLNKTLVVMAIAVMLVGASAVIAQDREQSRKRLQHTIDDSNGDGICDVCGQPVGSGQANAQGQQAKKGKHWGPGDGSGNQGTGPKDGTGYGSQSGKGTGTRDGTGAYHQRGSHRGGQGQGLGRRSGQS